MPDKFKRFSYGSSVRCYRIFKALLFSLIFVSLSASAHGQEKDILVTADGIGDIVAGAEGQARDVAFEDALRKAVEQAVGTLIESETVVQDSALVSDEILARSAGYVKKYDVISESKSESSYKVTIRALISSEKLSEDLTAIGLLLVRKHKPRIMVIIPERNLGKMVSNPSAETGLIKKFLEKGFTVVDQKQVAKIRYNDSVKAAIAGQPKLAAKIGLQYGAEVLVIGEAFSETVGTVFNGIISSRARIDVKVVKVDTADIMVADGRQASGLDITEGIAGKKAIQNVADEAADYLVDQILDKWKDEAANTTGFEIVVTGANYAQFQDFKSALSSLRWVKGVHQRSFSNNRAVVGVDLKGDSQTFVDTLASKSFNKIFIEIIDSSASRLEVKITSKQQKAL